MKRFLICVLCSTFSVPFMSAQQGSEVPVIRSATRLVVVDVTVTDRKGNPIHNLPQDAFTIYEDNRPQTIARFTEHAEGEAETMPPQPKAEPGVFTNAVPQSKGPLNVLVLDTLNTPLQDQMYVHSQLEKFVQNAKPGAQIAVLTITTKLNLIQSFTSDRDVLLQAVKNAKGFRSSPLLGGGGGEAGYTRLRMREDYTAESFKSLARFLSLFPGRKNVIWFSNGFPYSYLGNSFDTQFNSVFDMTPEFSEATYLFSMSQVAFYSIEARGLANNSAFDASHGASSSGFRTANQIGWQTMRRGEEEMVMRQMADDMGGKAYVATNDIAGSVASAIENGSNYYTIDYNPADHEMDGRRHQIQVRVNNPEYRLSYRTSYIASFRTVDGGKKGQSQTVAPLTPINLYMQRGAPSMQQVLFRIRVTPIGNTPGGSITNQLAPGSSADPKLKPQYRNFEVQFSADVSRITPKPLPNGKLHLEVEFVASVYDQDCALKTAKSLTASSDITPQKFELLKKEGLQLHMQISVPAKGDNYIRAGVHDMMSDRIGTLEVPVSDLKKLPAAQLVSQHGE